MIMEISILSFLSEIAYYLAENCVDTFCEPVFEGEHVLAQILFAF